MEQSFFDVVTEVRKITLGGPYTQDIHAALVVMEKEVIKTSEDERRLFVDAFYECIRQVVFQIRELIGKYPRLRSEHDRLFTKLLKLDKVLPLGITLLFEEFIKGITYFPTHLEHAHPIYHRLQSCGPGDDAFRIMFQQCKQGMTKEQREKVKKQIETCYVERLIYNEMFVNQSLHFPKSGFDEHQQDKQHMYRLHEVTRKDFKTCFPNLDIQVHVEFEQNMPTKVSIVRKLKVQKKWVTTSSEVYFKMVRHGAIPTYIPHVECTRTTNFHTYVKTQGYAQPEKWVKVGIKKKSA